MFLGVVMLAMLAVALFAFVARVLDSILETVAIFAICCAVVGWVSLAAYFITQGHSR